MEKPHNSWMNVRFTARVNNISCQYLVAAVTAVVPWLIRVFLIEIPIICPTLIHTTMCHQNLVLNWASIFYENGFWNGGRCAQIALTQDPKEAGKILRRIVTNACMGHLCYEECSGIKWADISLVPLAPPKKYGWPTISRRNNCLSDVTSSRVRIE